MTAILIYPSEDSYVNANIPDTPAGQFSSIAKLKVGINVFDLAGYHGLCISFVLFSLAGIPGGSTIISAQLTMDAFFVVGSYDLVTGQIFRCSNISWIESGLTWNNQPGGIAGLGSFALDSALGAQEFTVSLDTAQVQAALATGALSMGIATDMTLHSDQDVPAIGMQDYDFNSPVQAVRRPYLVINYTTGSARRRSSVVVG